MVKRADVNVGVHLSLSLSLFFLSFVLFKGCSWAYVGSQARGLIGATAAGLHRSHSNAQFRAVSVAYITAHGNAGSLTH